MFTLRLPRFWVFVVGVAAILLFAGATQAKLAQYESRDSNTRYLAKAVKIAKSSLEPGVWIMPVQQPSNDPPQLFRVGMVPPEVAVAVPAMVVLPRQSRAPPASRL
jgi:hypothetical protein